LLIRENAGFKYTNRWEKNKAKAEAKAKKEVKAKAKAKVKFPTFGCTGVVAIAHCGKWNQH
jgi:hypothetical protein